MATTNPVPSVYCAPSFLSAAECRQLADEIDAGPVSAAPVREAGRGDIIAEYRRRADCLVKPSETQAMVARRLAAIIPELAAHFGLGLAGLQPPQFLSYGRGGYFRPHTDRSGGAEHDPDVRHRRISAIVFLNDQASLPRDGGYCGGDLRLFKADDHPDPILSIAGETGMLAAFPAAVVHEVRPVTWGVRRTVAAWYVDA